MSPNRNPFAKGAAARFRFNGARYALDGPASSPDGDRIPSPRASMPKPITPALCALALALTAGAAHAADPPAGYERLTVTNTTDRVAFCTFIFEGKARTELAIRPGKSWFESFEPRRDLRLVCQRGVGRAFGPLAAGKTYRLVPAEGRKIAVAEGAGE